MMRVFDFESEGADWPDSELCRIVESGGRRFRVLETGSGPDLLLLHGTGGSLHGWSPLVPLLAGAFRVLAVDLPGHGFTPCDDPERLRRASMSRELGRLMRDLEWRPRIVVGHSAGTGVALEMALDGHLDPSVVVIGVNPSLVRPSTMPHPTPFGPQAARLLPVSAIAGTMVRLTRSETFIRQVVKSTGSELTLEQFELYHRIASSAGHVEAAIRMVAGWAPEEQVARYPELEGRVDAVHLLAGTRDGWISRRDTERAARALGPLARLGTFDAGHLGPEENPRAVARMILDLTELPAGD